MRTRRLLLTIVVVLPGCDWNHASPPKPETAPTSAPRPETPPTSAPKPEAPPKSAPTTGVADVYATLFFSRAQQLDRLHHYARRGLFPQNANRMGLTPVFVDERGVHCAIAYLMKTAGDEKLVKQVRRSNNLVQLIEVDQGPVVDWILRSGLTKEECELIQPSYNPLVVDEELEGRLRWAMRRVHVQPVVRKATPREKPTPMEMVAASLIQHRLLATERLLRKQTPQALEVATRRMLGQARLPIDRSFSFEIVAVGGALVPLRHAAPRCWVRLTYLDDGGRVLQTGTWYCWPGNPPLAERPPHKARRVLVEQTT